MTDDQGLRRNSQRRSNRFPVAISRKPGKIDSAVFDAGPGVLFPVCSQKRNGSRLGAKDRAGQIVPENRLRQSRQNPFVKVLFDSVRTVEMIDSHRNAELRRLSEKPPALELIVAVHNIVRAILPDNFLDCPTELERASRLQSAEEQLAAVVCQDFVEPARFRFVAHEIHLKEIPVYSG